MSNYEKSFKSVKASRKLIWQNGVGVVDISIQSGWGKLNLKVSPFQATVVLLFKDTDTMEFDDIVAKTGLTVTKTALIVDFWQTQGVLKKTRNLVVTVESLKRQTDLKADGSTDWEMNTDEEGAVTDFGHAEMAVEEEDESLKEQVWPYICGMLTNLGSMNAERIHQTLGMYGISITEAALQKIIDQMVSADAVELQENQYTVK